MENVIQGSSYACNIKGGDFDITSVVDLRIVYAKSDKDVIDVTALSHVRGSNEIQIVLPGQFTEKMKLGVYSLELSWLDNSGLLRKVQVKRDINIINSFINHG